MTKKEEFFQGLRDTFEGCIAISEKKNADYAGDEDPYKNFRLCEFLGVCSVETGILVRICDKISRISNLLNKSAMVADEKLEDTIDDDINYHAILKNFLKDKNKK